MADESAALCGLRILIVEDTLLVAEMIRDRLIEFGCIVVGPVPRLHSALSLARSEHLDGAILDINLRGEFSFSVAAELRDRDVPYFFLTGYDDPAVMPTAFRGSPRLGKPFRWEDLRRLMTHHFVRHPDDHRHAERL